jgi:triosephosphate isomerase
MRPVIVAANWKMNTTPADAGELARTIAARTAEPTVERVICPPFVCLADVGDALAGTGVAIGAQDIHHEAAGAFTGDISAAMLAGLATWVIVGHSERRRDHAETDERISAKLVRAVEGGLRPILCIGEPLSIREIRGVTGAAETFVVDQLLGAVGGHDAERLSRAGLVIAYEPIWAIGTGRTATPADAQAVCGLIRRLIANGFGSDAAAAIRIQYGGSVKPGNTADLMAEPDIDGALVGGASLDPDDFALIIGFGRT